MPEFVLEMKNLSASWNKNSVLQNVSVVLHSGEFICLTGPNGSGKSTLLSLLAGIEMSGLTIDSAEKKPSLNGYELIHFSRKQIASHISYLTQTEVPSWNYSVRDVVLTGRYSHTNAFEHFSAKDIECVDSVLDAVQITNLADRKIFSLSGGEFQKVRIARALAQEPDFLLLDEPIANLDFGYQTELLSLIKNLARGKIPSDKKPGVLVSIHDLNTAIRFSDNIMLLPKNGIPLSGQPEVVLTPQVLEQTYGVPFGTFIHPEYKCLQVFTK